MKKELKNYNQKFKIFGRKAGRKSFKNLNSKIYKKYLLNISSDLITKNIILDIGSGNGMNTLSLSQKNPNNLISFILGGNNRHYKFTKKSILDLVHKVKNLKKRYENYNFLIISSRRTSLDVIRFMKDKLNKIAYIWDGDGDNPYSFALNNSKFFVVTSDSTSMISECAFTGKPIFVYHLPFKRISKRIKSFHQEFENLKITKKFLDHADLNTWQYETLDEAKRISGILKERILEGLNESR